MSSQVPPPNDRPQPPSNADAAPSLAPSAAAQFPIVAIGASAGGLEAFIQLLRPLPADTGMAFVLLQHLSPDHPSELCPILARSVTMPVYEAVDGMAVQRNQVYVIPPNAEMTIAEGRLQLRSRDPQHGSRRVVDTFFHALAQDQGNRAIGVVLSGGDADGARGLEAIKGAGGVTFAQEHSSAQVGSMPDAAIATGQVDFVQPPAEIAQTLIHISRHPYVTTLQPEQVIEANDDEALLSSILQLLKRQTKVDFTKYKSATLQRRISRRMALYHLDDLDRYRQHLQENANELRELYQEILIGVTSFFRDPGAFEALRQAVFPALLRQRSEDTPIRIWVAGCSTGEEAYSIVMCLLEYLDRQPLAPPVQLFGTDLNEAAIEAARLGWYSSSQVAGVSPERLQRYFTPTQGGYQIKATVRELCIFARQNLLADPPFSQLDLISCRNLLIYLNAAAQRQVLPLLHYGLKPSGFLQLGTSETVGQLSPLFNLINSKYKLYSKQPGYHALDFDLPNRDDATAVTNLSVPISPSPRPSPLRLPPQQEPVNPSNVADQIVLNRYGPVGVLVNAALEILQFRGQTSNYLEPAPGPASLQLLSMTKAELQSDVRLALYQVQQSGQGVQRRATLRVGTDRRQPVDIEVLPFEVDNDDQPYYLVLFSAVPTPAEPAGESATDSDEAIAADSAIAPQQRENEQLREDLKATRAYLQSIIHTQEATNQDLRAANEEIMSSNEELQSTNEELQTAKEEIQATNEELGTINDELYRRNAETARISDDFQNLLSSIHIPVLMLEEDLSIRRFTPTAAELFNLIPSDVGRPLSDIHYRLRLDDLSACIRQVIDTLNQVTMEVQDEDGHWYELRIRPYRTLENRIDGAVVVLVDIDRLKQHAAELQRSRDYSDAIVQTVREPLLVLNAEFQVVTANREFYRVFQVTPEATEQRSVFELGNGQWDIPQLRELLHELLPQNSAIEDFVVEHDFETLGPQTMRLNARQISATPGEALILLAIEPARS